MLLTGHRKRSGLIKQSLSVLVSLYIKMLSTSTLVTLAAQSESVLCQGKERNRKAKKRESKRDRASGRDKWELSRDEGGLLILG